MSVKRKLKRKKTRESLYRTKPRTSIPIHQRPHVEAKEDKTPNSETEIDDTLVNEIVDTMFSSTNTGLPDELLNSEKYPDITQESDQAEEPPEPVFLYNNISREERGNGIIKEAWKYIGMEYSLDESNKNAMSDYKFVKSCMNDTGYYNIKASNYEELANIFKNNNRFEKSFDKAERGDVLFFANTNGNFPDGTITHVAFYIDPRIILHANSITKNINSTTDYEVYWSNYFAGVGKI